MKERVLSFVKRNSSPLIGMLGGVGIGLLLLIKPREVVQLAISIAGWTMILLGVARILQYLLHVRPIESAWPTVGLLPIVAGVITLSVSGLLMGVVPFLLGFALVTSGAIKFQGALDMRRMALGNWRTCVVMALFSALFGVLVLTRPFAMGEAMTRVIGLLLVIESVQDLYAYIKFSAMRG